MKKLLIISVISVMAFGFMASVAFAAQPTEPGCFGQDRSEWIHANSGKAWGEIARVRAGDNAQINHDYMESVCGKEFHE